ncbi:AMP-dependent synthetase/ligase, partial [candidate division KSB1 bacterium]
MIYKNLVKMFSDIAERNSEKTALMYKESGRYISISYKEFKEKVVNFASGLISTGVQKNDRIAILSENRHEWTLADLGIIHSGALTVPLYTSYPPKQIEYLLNVSGAKSIIVSNLKQLEKIQDIYNNLNSIQFVITLFKPNKKYNFKIKLFDDIIDTGGKNFIENKKILDELSELIQPDEVTSIIYTSGTTDIPKGVMLTHKNILSNLESATKVLSITNEDIFLSLLPLCHILERADGQFLPIHQGGSIAYAESISTLRENMLEIKPTMIVVVPRILEKMYEVIKQNIGKKPSIIKKIISWCLNGGLEYRKEKQTGKASLYNKIRKNVGEKLIFKKLQMISGGRLRYFVCGGAHLNKNIGEFFDSVGIKILEGYGLTETSPVIAVNPPSKQKFGTVGKPLPDIEVQISNDGEILTRSQSIMKGYYNDEEATKLAINNEGWFHTGDLGFLDEEGYLTITDRKKDIIVISSGKNISPQLVEETVLTSKYINQTAVLGYKKKFISALIVPDF